MSWIVASRRNTTRDKLGFKGETPAHVSVKASRSAVDMNVTSTAEDTVKGNHGIFLDHSNHAQIQTLHPVALLYIGRNHQMLGALERGDTLVRAVACGTCCIVRRPI